jgi:hypothetical protein
MAIIANYRSSHACTIADGMALYPQEMNMPSNEDIFLTLLVMLTSWLFTSEVVRYFLALDILLRDTEP